ncbi:hypothetical protein EXU48_09030 [Occultella glacieicola]|uniref:Lipoprotein n=1 Tax=Occultella glacieicola TaxID=2518684 RepID=A0ABY2E879_9MICO|nr:hypothetical protein [Occultella glacieicola]TDE94917.1 hypothetical protein EXU48_09030 [Occultella glacieicola]
MGSTHRARLVGAAMGTIALVATMLSGCSWFGLEPDEPVACAQAGPPSTAAGETAPILTIARGSTSDLVLVVYADGNVATHDEATASALTGAAAAMLPRYAGGPYQGGAVGSWAAGYLNSCALDRLHTLAQDALWDDPEPGFVQVTDMPDTHFHYTDGGSVADVDVYAHDSGYTSGLSWAERRVRDRIVALTDFLDANVVVAGGTLPVTELQIDGDGAVDADFVWPLAAPPADLLTGAGCAVIVEADAATLYAYVLENDLDVSEHNLAIRALPPGVAGCQR